MEFMRREGRMYKLGLSLVILTTLSSAGSCRFRTMTLYNVVEANNETRLRTLLQKDDYKKCVKKGSALFNICFDRSIDNNWANSLKVFLEYCPDPNPSEEIGMKICEQLENDDNTTMSRTLLSFLDVGCGGCIDDCTFLKDSLWIPHKTENIFSNNCSSVLSLIYKHWDCNEKFNWIRPPVVKQCELPPEVNPVTDTPHDEEINPLKVTTLAEEVNPLTLTPQEIKQLFIRLDYSSHNIEKKWKDKSMKWEDVEEPFHILLKIRQLVKDGVVSDVRGNVINPPEFEAKLTTISINFTKSIQPSLSKDLSGGTSFLQCIGEEANEINDLTDLLGHCNDCTAKGAIGNTDGNSNITSLENFLAEKCGKCLSEERTTPDITVSLTATAVGEKFVFSCNGSNNKAFWQCGKGALWEETPDLSQCLNTPMVPNELDSGTFNLTEKIKVIQKQNKSIANDIELYLKRKDPADAQKLGEEFLRSLLDMQKEVQRNNQEIPNQDENNSLKDIEAIKLRVAVATAKLIAKTFDNTSSSSMDTFFSCMKKDLSKNISLSNACDSCPALGEEKKAKVSEESSITERVLRVRCGKCVTGERSASTLNYTWSLNATSVGEVIQIPCPPGFSEHSYGTWRCLEGAVWDRMPDLSNCRSNITASLPPVESLDDNTTPTEEVISMFESINEKELLPGDRSYVLDRLDFLLNISKQGVHNQSDIEVFAEEVTSGLNDMLEDSDILKDISEDKAKEMFNKIQEYVVAVSLQRAKNLHVNGTYNYLSENINVRMVKGTKRYFSERTNRQFKDSSTGGTLIELPEDFLDYPLRENDTKTSDTEGIAVGFYAYSNLHCKNNSLPCDSTCANLTDLQLTRDQLNSFVVGATVGYETWKAVQNSYVEVTFMHIYNGTSINLTNQRCVWWNTKNLSWDITGCTLNKTNNTYTICHCDHLTNLAAIMDVQSFLHEDLQHVTNVVLEWITIVGCSVSIVCLALTIVTLIQLKRLRSQGRQMMRGTKEYLVKCNLCGSLMLFLFIFVIFSRMTNNMIFCGAIAAVLHFLLLATFNWSAIEAFTIYMDFYVVLSKFVPTFKWYLVIGYGLPFFFVVSTLLGSLGQGYGTREFCWLEPGTMWSFIASFGIIMLINLAAYVLVLYTYFFRKKPNCYVGGNPNSKRQSTKQIMRYISSSAATFCTLGLMWLTGLLIMFTDIFAFQILFVLSTSCQGTFVFLFEVVLKADRRGALINLIEQTFKVRLSNICRKSDVRREDDYDQPTKTLETMETTFSNTGIDNIQ